MKKPLPRPDDVVRALYAWARHFDNNFNTYDDPADYSADQQVSHELQEAAKAVEFAADNSDLPEEA